LEHFWQGSYERRIANVCSANSEELLRGGVRLETSLPRQLDRFLSGERWLRWGLGLAVTVRTAAGRLLYPSTDLLLRPGPPEEDPLQVAAANFDLLRDGLQIEVQARVDHNTRISNALLGLYVGLALSFLGAVYRSAQRRVRRAALGQTAAMEELARQEARQRRDLEALSAANADLRLEIARLQQQLDQERHRASRNEDDLLNEMVVLERQLDANLAQQRTQEEEIARLRSAMDEATPIVRPPKGGSLTAVEKRLRALYKELSFTDYAIEGFRDLPAPLQIKAEEIIHQLNQNPEVVDVKRKVFRGKGKETVFEVVFAYKGRLYFRRNRARRVDVLAVGTKNRQARDLDYLDRV
jgi:hypothetical protein